MVSGRAHLHTSPNYMTNGQVARCAWYDHVSVKQTSLIARFSKGFLLSRDHLCKSLWTPSLWTDITGLSALRLWTTRCSPRDCSTLFIRLAKMLISPPRLSRSVALFKAALCRWSPVRLCRSEGKPHQNTSPRHTDASQIHFDNSFNRRNRAS